MAKYGFIKYAYEDIRTAGIAVPAVSESDSATGTTVTYCVLPTKYTIDGQDTKTIPAGSIVQFKFTAGSSGVDNKIEVVYVSEIGENELTDDYLGVSVNDIKANAFALLAEDYTIGDVKLVYYLVERKSNLEVR